MVVKPAALANRYADSNNGHKPAGPAALELKQVTAGYGQRRVVEGVSVKIAAGRRVGLIGPNGAGKTTLFRVIVGLLTPMNGQVLVNGRSDRQSRRNAAYVPQFEDVDWNFPVAVIDVVVMGLSRQVGWLRLPGRRHLDLAREALGRVGMADHAGRPIGELSGGQKRRVFVARALAQGANILLLDEPFSGVDAAAQQAIVDILNDLSTQGVTLLLATHDLNLAAAYFDELLILNQRLIAYGKPEEVFKPALLAQAFGGQLAIWQDEQHLIMLTDQHA
jgi:manganese/iron transport system ATP-binding protein